MTGVDWLIVAVVTLFALFGFHQGFVVGALTLAGFAGGAFAGSRLGPELLNEGARSPYAPLFALGGAILAGAVLAGLFELLGREVRGRLGVPGIGVVDGLLGALLSAVVALGLAWLVGAVALQTPGATTLRADIQRSLILQRLNDTLPPSGPVLNALARFDPLPEVRGPAADVRAPTSWIARDDDVRAAAARVVRIRGTACGLGVEGSGWVADGGLVVTNAHVVAGQDDTIVQPAGSPPDLPAQAVAFDVRNDLAVLRVPALDRRALPLADEAPRGRAVAILGFPLDGPYDVRAARVGDARTVLTQDAYGAGPLRRRVLAFRGTVRSGNSGGPLVDARGRVVGTVFAAATSGGPRTGYAVPNDIVRRALQRARRSDGPVDTGPCVR